MIERENDDRRLKQHVSGTTRRKVALALTSIPCGGSRINRNHWVIIMIFTSTAITRSSDRGATVTTERDRSDP